MKALFTLATDCAIRTPPHSVRVYNQRAKHFGCRVRNEAAYTFSDEQPAGYAHAAQFCGVEAVGNVHPVDLGFSVIARDVAAAGADPEPANWSSLSASFGLIAHCRGAWRKSQSPDGASFGIWLSPTI